MWLVTPLEGYSEGRTNLLGPVKCYPKVLSRLLGGWTARSFIPHPASTPPARQLLGLGVLVFWSFGLSEDQETQVQK